MFEKFKPYGDRLLIKRVAEPEKTQGGIYIPDAAKEKAQTGAVLAVGNGRLDKDGSRVPPLVNKGDMVYFGKFAGTEVDTDHVILREDEVLGIVEQ